MDFNLSPAVRMALGWPLRGACGLALLALFATGCGPRLPVDQMDATANWKLLEFPDAPRSLKGELRIMAAPFHLPPEVIERFETRYGVKVRTEPAQDNGVLDDLVRNGRFDLVIAGTHLVQQWINEKRLRPIDSKRMPNLRHIDPEYFHHKHDPGLKFTAPLYQSAMGVAMNMKYVSGLPLTWPEFAHETNNQFAVGRVAALDEMRPCLGTALLMLKFSPNTRDPAEIAQARDLLLGTKKQTGLALRARQQSGMLGTEEIILAVVTNGDAARSLHTNSAVRFIIPRGPSIVNIESLCIPANAPNPLAAEFFIDFLNTPEVIGALTNFSHLGNASPASGAFVSAAIRNGPGFMRPLVNDAVFLEDVGDAVVHYREAWTAVKEAPEPELKIVPLPFARTNTVSRR